MVGVAQCEEASHPNGVEAVAQPRSSACFNVGNPALCILTFQVDVHDERVILAFSLAALLSFFFFGPFLVHFYLVDGVGRQVGQGNLRVALEEVAAVDEQRADVLPVDGDAPAVLELDAGQGAHEAFEHGALGHLEGRGVVDERVAVHHHLDFRGFHGGFAQVIVHLAPQVDVG